MRRCARSGGNISLSVSKRFPLRKKQAENNLFRPCLIFGLTCAVLQVRLKDLLGREIQMQKRVARFRGWLAMAAVGLAALLWTTAIGVRAQQGGMAAAPKEQPYVVE